MKAKRLTSTCRLKVVIFFNDLSDHLSNYTVLLNVHHKNETVRPLVRISSQKNKETFLNILKSANWSVVCSQNDVNIVYYNLIKIITDAYEVSFTVTGVV
jgi:hypothetical protein